jgi:hypothetical protein
MIDAVAEWRQRRPSERIRRALIPILRDRFNVTTAEAVEIVRTANKEAPYAKAS